jgi:DNA-binding HxlR family transcriptional regulator
MEPKTELACPVDYGFQRLGGKYKGRLLLYLSTGTKRYGEIRRFIVGITQKMLTQALREMEEDGLVHRKEYAEIPPRVEYSITEEGKEVVPVIRKIEEWGTARMKERNIPIIQVGVNN